jgi:hypothetical protein
MQVASENGQDVSYVSVVCDHGESKPTRTHGPLYSSFIRPSQQDSLYHPLFTPSTVGPTYHFI